MTTESKPTDRLVIGSQYFLYFGVLGMYLPFFNLYCYHLGFSGLNIGILSAVRSVAMVFFPLIWGTLADRLGARRSIYILCSFCSALIWMQYLFTVDFGTMLAITIVYGTFYAPIISFLEAFTMDILGKEKKSYGHLRVWGSISFITVVLVLGKIIDLYSIEIIVVLILAGLLMFALMSTRIPATRPLKRTRLSKGAKSLLDVRVLVFLFCAFLMLVSHGAYYGFFSIHLENLGYGSTFIGLAWAFASAAEILVMIRSEQIFQRFSLESVLIFSFMVAALRWFVLFWGQSAAVILASQVLHAITYGTFHIASILYIDRLTPDKAKTLGQAANNALSYGLGLMVGFFFNGYIYEISGSFSLFMISSLIALSGGLIFWGFYVVNRK
ncbi:MAG: MFS transporter [Deltaproteobacteria bacterium]|jgi:PPP family 3-phenylpropionic acid transporter|nr:MFS transporter [Deltaproteobacteria bacterium]MBW2516920.1 MFS transporter [Deltaproteobacteria bacterium]